MNKELQEKGIGTEKIGIIPKVLISERAWERAVWRIRRWASEEDRRAGKIYSKEEAIKLFGVPQFTTIQGGIQGVAIALREGTFFPTLAKKLEGINLFSWTGIKELFRALRRMFHGNLMLNEGINELFTLICSASGTKYDNTNAQTGVGDSTAAEAATQTDLQGANKTYKGMVAGFPTYGTGQKATWKSEYGGADANYAWQEFIVRNGATALKDILRKVSAQGTKTSGQIWELSVELTLS